jgi:hypothetical protein
VAKAPKKKRELPVCVAMLLCESVIVAEDKTVSAIRIIDRIGMLKEPDASDTDGGVEFQGIKLLIMLKADMGSGEYKLLITCTHKESGNSEPIGLFAPNFDDKTSGANAATPLRIKWHGQGTYWIEASIDNEVIGRTPAYVFIEKPATPRQRPSRKGKS